MKNEELFGSIKNLMRTKVPKVTKNLTVQQVLFALKKESKVCESIDYIYVVEKSNNLVGVLSIKDLFRFPQNAKVEDFMSTKVFSVSPNVNHETIAHLALKHGIKSVPVVESGKLIGVIPPKEILYAMNLSLRKDIFHLAGIHKAHLEYEHTGKVPLFTSVMHRIPWIIVGLIGIILTAAFIGVFEATLEKHIILAFFIPVIVYVSDALGTQIQTLFIRDLAVMGDELKIPRYLARQLSISGIMALAISVAIFVIVTIFWKQPYAAFVIGISTLAALILTSLTAFGITYFIKRAGGDPALGGGPFATVVSDATSIIIYFLIATALL